MAIRDIPAWFGAKRKVRVGTKMSYNVTVLGKQKAERFDLEGPRWQVLAYLSEQGPAGVPELVRETNLSEDKVKLILKGLMESGFVMTATGE